MSTNLKNDIRRCRCWPNAPCHHGTSGGCNYPSSTICMTSKCSNNNENNNNNITKFGNNNDTYKINEISANAKTTTTSKKNIVSSYSIGIIETIKPSTTTSTTPPRHLHTTSTTMADCSYTNNTDDTNLIYNDSVYDKIEDICGLCLFNTSFLDIDSNSNDTNIKYNEIYPYNVITANNDFSSARIFDAKGDFFFKKM